MPEKELVVGWALRPVHVPGLPPWIDVHPEQGLSVGRAPDNDLRLAAETHAPVSAHHVRIAMRDGQPHVLDLGSTNGTFVNGIRIDEKLLKSGDLVSLGHTGPKFVVERRSSADRTRLMRTAEVAPKLGESTIQLMREAVGLDGGAGVGDVVRRGDRSHKRRLAIVTAGVLVAGTVAVLMLRDANAREIDRLEKVNAQLRAQLVGTNEVLQRQQQEWVAQRAGLERERDALTERLSRVEQDEATSTEGLGDLRARLELAQKRLELYDPVNLERTRLQGVKNVRDAVVFIEAAVRLKCATTGDLVRAEQDETGSWNFHLGGTGEVLSRDKTGSGFVVSDTGFILTNAHVVEAADIFESNVKLADGTEVEPDVELLIVFNDHSERRVAKLISAVHDDHQDFALLKIEPFEGMPFIRDFRAERPQIAAGSEVYLFGFPLGRMLVQPEDRVVASTFKGILSRDIAPMLQVDAAVHPGNSGGPVTDATGRVIGIVTAVQRMPEGHITPAIGYVMPIEAIASIWPPK